MKAGFVIRSLSLYWEGHNGINLRWGGDVSTAKVFEGRDSALRAAEHLKTQVDASRRDGVRVERVPQHLCDPIGRTRFTLDALNELVATSEAPPKYEDRCSKERGGVYVSLVHAGETRVFFVGMAWLEKQFIVEHVY